MRRRAAETRPERTAEQMFALNERVNQKLLEHLDAGAWSAKPVGGVRTIAAVVAHMHNVRVKWVRLNAPEVGVPVQLKRAHCTQEEARAALAASAVRCVEMLASGMTVFLRDGWARPWPVGAEMLCYMLAHEAHHRGQVCMLAHQVGFPLPDVVTSGMWSWESLWGEGLESGAETFPPGAKAPFILDARNGRTEARPLQGGSIKCGKADRE